MNPRLRTRLDQHRADFERWTGSSFEHFVCPILNVDQAVDLQIGHVINQAIEGSPGTWVVQRRDVDSFYGSFFEADFEGFLHVQKLTHVNIFANKKLKQHFKPRILLGEKSVKYFLKDGMPPDGYHELLFEADEEAVSLCVNATAEEMQDGKWSIEISKDARIAAIVTSLKAAHLSMFSLFGYRYALSDAGRFVGLEILGKFFLQNRHSPKRKPVLENALKFFHEFRHMVRILYTNRAEIAGTLTDGSVLLCASTGGEPWGMIVFVKTGPIRNAVLLPVPDNMQALVTFLEFLRNDHETIHTMTGRFDRNKQRWDLNPERQPMNWPKSTNFFPLRIE